MSNVNLITFPSADGQAILEAAWHLPTRRATNGAVIVAHGANNDKDYPLFPALCDGAAALGLTAVRFDFRFRHGGEKAKVIDDLLGAYNFLDGFGKEIKPKRYYLIGKSLGGRAALMAISKGGPLAGEINGVAVLGLPLHSPGTEQLYDQTFLEQLTCPVLFVVGERDPLGTPEELRPLLERVPVSTQLEVIEKAGHSYEYIPAEGETPLSPEEAEAFHSAQLQKVVDITIKWLEEQDKIREDLRK
jgi:predicted alpha/beta-hydrolase family hydrolase